MTSNLYGLVQNINLRYYYEITIRTYNYCIALAMCYYFINITNLYFYFGKCVLAFDRHRGQPHAIATSAAPSAMKPTPAQPIIESRSPSTTAAMIATMTTLSLSIGATFDASPSCSARK